jgi:arylsulfatase A-like enzyme
VVEISNENTQTKPDSSTFPVWFLKSHLNRALAIGLSLGLFWGFGEAFFLSLPEFSRPWLLGEMTTFIVVSSLLHAILGALAIIVFAPFIYILYRVGGSRIKLIDPVAFYISIFIFFLAFVLQLWQMEQIVKSTTLWGLLAHIQVLIFSLAIAWACYRFILWVLKHRLAKLLVSDLILSAMALLSFLASRRLFFLVEEKMPLFQGFMGFLFAIVVALAAIALGLVLFRRAARPNRIWHPSSILVILGLLVMLGALGTWWFIPSANTKVNRPNIVLITLDTVRADDLGMYNPQRDCSPNLDRFAGESVTFHRATAVAPITVPSHVSMLTGRYPSFLGVWANGDRLPDDVPTVAEILQKNGYKTAAFVSSRMLESRFSGLSRGFDVYDDNLSTLGLADELNSTLLVSVVRKWLNWDPLNAYKRLSENTVDHALQWLGNQEDPFFLWVHLFDAHIPYDAPRVDRFRYTDRNYQGIFNGSAEQARLVISGTLDVSPADAKFIHDMYLGEIYYQDKQLGRLLNVLSEEKWQSNTLIIVCADHGEGFEKNHYFNHVDRLWQTMIWVPLIMHLPNSEDAGTQNYDLVTPMDFFNTALAYAGLTVPEGYGVVLPDLLKSDKTPQNRSIYSFCISAFHPNPEGQERSIITSDNMKLIWYQGFGWKELYNLNSDPDEINNLLDKEPQTAGQLFEELTAFFNSIKPKTGSGELGNAQTDALRGLGYMGN